MNPLEDITPAKINCENMNLDSKTPKSTEFFKFDPNFQPVRMCDLPGVKELFMKKKEPVVKKEEPIKLEPVRLCDDPFLIKLTEELRQSTRKMNSVKKPSTITTTSTNKQVVTKLYNKFEQTAQRNIQPPLNRRSYMPPKSRISIVNKPPTIKKNHQLKTPLQKTQKENFIKPSISKNIPQKITSKTAPKNIDNTVSCQELKSILLELKEKINRLETNVDHICNVLNITKRNDNRIYSKLSNDEMLDGICVMENTTINIDAGSENNSIEIKNNLIISKQDEISEKDDKIDLKQNNIRNDSIDSKLKKTIKNSSSSNQNKSINNSFDSKCTSGSKRKEILNNSNKKESTYNSSDSKQKEIKRNSMNSKRQSVKLTERKSLINSGSRLKTNEDVTEKENLDPKIFNKSSEKIINSPEIKNRNPDYILKIIKPDLPEHSNKIVINELANQNNEENSEKPINTVNEYDIQIEKMQFAVDLRCDNDDIENSVKPQTVQVEINNEIEINMTQKNAGTNKFDESVNFPYLNDAINNLKQYIDNDAASNFPFLNFSTKKINNDTNVNKDFTPEKSGAYSNVSTPENSEEYELFLQTPLPNIEETFFNLYGKDFISSQEKTIDKIPQKSDRCKSLFKTPRNSDDFELSLSFPLTNMEDITFNVLDRDLNNDRRKSLSLNDISISDQDEIKSDMQQSSPDILQKTLTSYNALRTNNFLCTPKVNFGSLDALMTPSVKLSQKKLVSRKIQQQLYMLNNL